MLVDFELAIKADRQPLTDDRQSLDEVVRLR